MAIGRLSMKVGKAGRAAPHAAYISRSGQYAKLLERGEKLEATEYGNMPQWAASNPLQFWEAADANERKNGTTYREMEIALPREMNPAQRLELIRDFVKQEIGDRHAYHFAIHNPTASDGGEQPHAHLMFSERQADDIERDPEQYFRRYNSKNPERGGAKKGYGERAGETLTKAERTAELKALRGRWETQCNGHLGRAYFAAQIDMRSHAERGTGLVPEIKQLPSQWRDPEQRAEVMHFREIRREQQQTTQELNREIPSAFAETETLSGISALTKAHEQRTKQEKQGKQTKQRPPVDEATLAKEWGETRQEMIREREIRAKRLSDRADAEATDISRTRSKMWEEHLKKCPQEPRGILAVFKRKGYNKALSAWSKEKKAIDQWKDKREQNLWKRAYQLHAYSRAFYSIEADVDRKMKRERPEDARTVAQYEHKQRKIRQEREQQQRQAQRQRSRSRVRDRGGMEL